jgi:hypothetical protein
MDKAIVFYNFHTQNIIWLPKVSYTLDNKDFVTLLDMFCYGSGYSNFLQGAFQHEVTFSPGIIFIRNK